MTTMKSLKSRCSRTLLGCIVAVSCATLVGACGPERSGYRAETPGVYKRRGVATTTFEPLDSAPRVSITTAEDVRAVGVEGQLIGMEVPASMDRADVLKGFMVYAGRHGADLVSDISILESALYTPAIRVLSMVDNDAAILAEAPRL